MLPFKEPSTPQVTKVFRKVKKLKIPEWGKHGFTEQYLCRLERRWDSEKFILAYRENKLIGVHGTFHPPLLKVFAPSVKQSRMCLCS